MTETSFLVVIVIFNNNIVIIIFNFKLFIIELEFVWIFIRPSYCYLKSTILRNEYPFSAVFFFRNIILILFYTYYFITIFLYIR